jgi:hypothetical protein
MDTEKYSIVGVSMAWAAVKVVLLAVATGIVWYWRPLFHWVIYPMRYSPIWAVGIGSTVLVAVLLFVAPPMGEDDGFNSKSSAKVKMEILGGWFVIALVIATVMLTMAGMFQSVSHADQTMDRAQTVEELPPMDAENPRIAPRSVAERQTRGSVSYRKYQLGEASIVRGENGSLKWSFPAEPQGIRNSVVEEQDGIVTTDITKMSGREIKTGERTDMVYGEGMTVGFSKNGLENRNVEWKMKKGDYWTTYKDTGRAFFDDGEPYMYYPKTGHEIQWLPVPHRTVTWDGGALVHANGTIEHLSPAEARSHEVLEGQPLYPYHNTRVRLGDIGYREGIVNAWIEHQNQVERAELPSGAGNEQPFTIDQEEGGMTYVTTMEPYGEDTRALDEVWFTDARTGNFTVYETGSESLIGPERAMDIARGTDTRTNWGEDFSVVEPVPVVINGELWWHSKVVTGQGTDVTRNIFVHASADDGRTAQLYTTEGAVSLLDGEGLSTANSVDDAPDSGSGADSASTNPGGSTGEDDVGYVLVVTDENGDVVETVPVEDGESFDVQTTQTTQSTNETTTEQRAGGVVAV